MNRHEQAKQIINRTWATEEDREIILKYINEAEATEKAYQELQRDTSELLKHIRELGMTLSKVGVEE